MDTSTLVTWHFTAAVCPDRVVKIQAWVSYEQIVEQLAACAVLPLYWEPAYSLNLSGCHRASFELDVGHDLYDAFFNSPTGYRGQYAVSETRGEAANRKLIDALRPSLLRCAQRDPNAHQQWVAASLQGSQAKVWIVESEVDEQLTVDTPSIDYPPWEFNAPNGQGLRAPYGTRLEVKGGWLDPSGKAKLDPSKQHRSSHIHKTGDSK